MQGVQKYFIHTKLEPGLNSAMLSCSTQVTLNHQEGNLKVQFLFKIGYYIVPNPSTTLKKGRPEPEMWSMLYTMLVLLMDKFVGLRQWTNLNCTIMLKNFRLVQSRTSCDMDRLLCPVSFISNYSLGRDLRRTQAGY